MPRFVMLGTGSALPGADRENTYLVIQGDKSEILIDCAGAPTGRLSSVGLSVQSIDTVILTHTHPDHIYGWPIFALNSWMAGRRQPLQVYGLADTVRAARSLLTAVGASEWPDFFRVRYHRVELTDGNPFFETEEFRISGMLTRHFVPTLALRIESIATGHVLAYSSDTSPIDELVELFRGCEYLVHEATTLETPSEGHSSALEAGEAARKAGARRLVLAHLPPGVRPARWRRAARTRFSGPVIVARDLQSFSF